MTQTEINIMLDQLKTLNFCLTQIAENPKINRALQEPYKIVALLAIDNIIQALDDYNEESR
jgi:hypothetical protein